MERYIRHAPGALVNSALLPNTWWRHRSERALIHPLDPRSRSTHRQRCSIHPAGLCQLEGRERGEWPPYISGTWTDECMGRFACTTLTPNTFFKSIATLKVEAGSQEVLEK